MVELIHERLDFGVVLAGRIPPDLPAIGRRRGDFMDALAQRLHTLPVHAPGPTHAIVDELISIDEAAALGVEPQELFAGMYPALAVADRHQPAHHPRGLVRWPCDGVEQRDGFPARAAFAA
ncbi:MAG: hypothetical protein HUU27_11240, partial [Phycisphaerae bacterium]|nr:hypothetical protein [Phycisphaerae bacterium]